MSVEFDPVPLRRPRRRTYPVVIVTAAMLLGLTIAVLKPWDGPPVSPNGIAVASASPAVQASQDATVVAPDSATPAAPESTRPPATALSCANIERSPVPSQVFSVDVVTVDWTASTGSAGYPIYSERTHRPTPGGPTIIDTQRDSIAALGVTTDRGSIVEDVRIWRVRPKGDLAWVDADPIEGTVAGGPLVLAIPGQASAFPAGAYRIDALVDGAIRRVDVVIPGTTEHSPP